MLSFSNKKETLSFKIGGIFMDKELELIRQVREGSEEAFECIFKKYMPIVLRQRSKSYLRFYDLDDWLQEGRIVCYQSIHRFDAHKNVTFGLFFKINFERWVISAIRYQEAQKRKINHMTESLDYYIELKGEGFNNVQEDPRAKTSLEYVFVRETLESFSTCLSDLERNIYAYVLQGEDMDSISRHLNISRRKVECGYSRLKRKLKNKFS